jgi:hypothetical protein
MEPRGFKRTLDVGGPSERKEKSTNIYNNMQNVPESSKAKGVNSTTTLANELSHPRVTHLPTNPASGGQVSQPTPLPTPNY